MNSLETIARLQQRLADAQRQHAHAEGALSAARLEHDTVWQEIRDEYHVDTLDQADRLLTQMRTELDKIAADIAAILDGIGVA